MTGTISIEMLTQESRPLCTSCCGSWNLRDHLVQTTHMACSPLLNEPQNAFLEDYGFVRPCSNMGINETLRQ